MDLSPGQQKAVFVLIVVVLAALGYWLVLPKLTHSHGHPRRPPRHPGGDRTAPPTPTCAEPPRRRR